MSCRVKWAVFDYGGVLAEEGFVDGLHAMAGKAGLDPDHVFQIGRRLIFSSGYLVGKALEETFWMAFRRETGIIRPDDELRNEILSRFVIRQWMLDIVAGLKSRQVRTAILSDQVNWLDELDVRDGFFQYFDRVYNSFHVNMSKNDPAIFDELVQWIDCSPGEILFVDDHAGHVQRAASKGLNTIHYVGRQEFIKALSAYCPDIT